MIPTPPPPRFAVRRTDGRRQLGVLIPVLLAMAASVPALPLKVSVPAGLDTTQIDPRLAAFGLYGSQSLKLNDGVARVEYGTVETNEQQTEAVIWLTARTAQEIVTSFMDEFGGYKNLTEMKKDAKAEEKAAAAANAVDPLNDDDEEL